MFPTTCFLESLFLIIFGSFTLSSSISEPTQKDYSLCAPFEYRCGDEAYKIYYPFRLPTSPDYCGIKEYELTCTPDNKSLVATISNKEYQVNSIDYDIQIISVTDRDFMDQPCIQTFTNTSINPLLFDYGSGYVNLTLFFNCSRPDSMSIPKLYNITCPGSDSYSFFNLPNDPLILDVWNNCNSMVFVPIDSSVLRDSISNYVNYVDYVDKFMGGLKKGFNLTWNVGDGWCSKCTEANWICWSDYRMEHSLERCYCGNASTSNDGDCTFHIKSSSNGASKKKIVVPTVGSAAGVGFLVLCLSLVLYFCKHRNVSEWVIFGKKDLNNYKKIEALLEEYGSITPKRYSHSNVREMTKAFHEKLGQGGYGTVYKGTLRNGHMVAVKMLNDSKGDGEEFINEVASICRTSHVNIVSLLGFCHEGSKQALIYDFMCNGSLEKLLYSEKQKTNQDWQKLYQIAVGIARGLEYLHRGCNTRIVHFDIKPHNILLDQNFCPKISDFGLAKLCLKKESIISIAGARGTIGYIAPEVFSRSFGVVSSKSDVYSYGMLVLDIVGGRKNPNEGVVNSSETYFPHWIYAQLHQNGHLSTYGVTAESEEIARKMVLVGLWCIQTLPENRPSMSRVVEMMEGSVDDLQVPPKPYLSSSPSVSIIGTSAVQDVECSSSVDS